MPFGLAFVRYAFIFFVIRFYRTSTMGVSTLLFLGAVYLCTALAAPMDDGTYSNSTLRFHDERLSNSTRFLERRWKSGKSNAEKGVNDFEQARIPDDMFLIGYKRIPAVR